jgi:hypothetical protein
MVRKARGCTRRRRGAEDAAHARDATRRRLDPVRADTPRDKGDQTTIPFTRYERGMWALNGRPQTSAAAVAWVLTGAMMKLEEERGRPSRIAGGAGRKSAQEIRAALVHQRETQSVARPTADATVRSARR